MTPPDPDQRIRFTFQVGEFSTMGLPALPLRPPLRLTRGEQQVIVLVLQGKSDAQIAKLRKTTVRTVLNQLTSINRKLGVRSREALVDLLRR